MEVLTPTVTNRNSIKWATLRGGGVTGSEGACEDMLVVPLAPLAPVEKRVVNDDDDDEEEEEEEDEDGHDKASNDCCVKSQSKTANNISKQMPAGCAGIT